MEEITTLNDIVEIRSRYFWNSPFQISLNSMQKDIQHKDLWVLDYLNEIPFKTEPISHRVDIIRAVVLNLFIRVTIGPEMQALANVPSKTFTYLKNYESDLEEWELIASYAGHDELINSIREGENAKVKLRNRKINEIIVSTEISEKSIARAIVDLIVFWMMITGEKVPRSNEYSKGIENSAKPNLDSFPDSYKFIIRCLYSCGLRLRSSNVITKVANKDDNRNIYLGFDDLTDLSTEPFKIQYS